MSDSLRDRIAQVLHRRFGPSLGAGHDGWDREPKATQDMYREDADAVIAALGLRRESNQAESGMDEMGVTYRTEGRHRYVTEWQPDE